MYQQTGLFTYKFRFFAAGITAVAFLVLVSVLVTTLGANTILDTRTHPSADVIGTVQSGGPNMVTTGMSELGIGAERVLLAAGTGLYSACRSVSGATKWGVESIGHGSSAVVGSIWHGTAFVLRGIGSIAVRSAHAAGTGAIYTVRIPGKIIGSISSGRSVSALIRPSDNKDDAVPVISAETSAAALAHLSATQQQEISKLQSAQLAANRKLDGSIIAGDPKRGGYPAKWDNVPQDSRLDSWGMYNRECVSYAAWKVYQTFGHMPYWGGVGNANEWVGDARRAGIPTGSTPEVHSVAIWRVGYYGHAMWVEKVSGNMVYVSQYNYNLDGRYSEMWVNGSQFTYIYFK